MKRVVSWNGVMFGGGALLGPEISDVIVDFDPATLVRRPVRKSELVRMFNTNGNRAAERVVAALPATDDVLDDAAVDQLLVRVHCERQRLSEEFEQGLRLALVLTPVVDAIRHLRPDTPISIVDVGCANGYAIRYLAASHAFGSDVKLVGVDFNPALVDEANKLAAQDELDVDFRVANALTMDDPGTIVMSTGVAHHFRGDALGEFFRRHDRAQTLALMHFDLQPSLLTTFGTWLLHMARVELALTRHDGVLSARRAHSLRHLLSTATAALPEFRMAVYHSSYGPFPCTLPAVFGARPELFEAVRSHLPLRDMEAVRSW